MAISRRSTPKPKNTLENAASGPKRIGLRGLPATVGGLKSWKQNPRKITPERMKGLRTSMKRFADISGIVYNLRTGRLVAGHQRIKNLKKTSRIRTEGGLAGKPDRYGTVGWGYIEHGQRWRVRFVDVDENTEFAMNVTANNPEIGGFFIPSLDDILGKLEKSMPDFYKATSMNLLAFYAGE